MTETETLHPELTADLVERVAQLSPEAFDSLLQFRDREAKLDAEYQAQVRAHIRAITLRVAAGTEPMHDWEDVVAELKAEEQRRDGQ